MLGVSDRKERSFNKIVLWLGQLDSSAVMVNVGSKNLFWIRERGSVLLGFCDGEILQYTALKYSKAGGGFITTPQAETSLLQRTARVSLGADGGLNGEITVNFKGEDALEHRLDALDEDEAGRRKSLEDEVKAWLPIGAVVKLQDAQGWESIDDPLVARFKIEIPGFASTAGKRLLLPAYFFPTLQKNMFTSQFRRYPITFSLSFYGRG